MSAVLAVCEQRDGTLRTVSQEVVTAARRLADALEGEVEALVLGTGAVAGSDALGRFGADSVVTLTAAAFTQPSPEAYARTVAERVRAGGYTTVVFAASATGKDLAPRVAARLGVALAQDVTDLAVESGAVLAVRPVCAGKALLRVKVTTRPALLTVRPNVFTPVERPRPGAAHTTAVEAPVGRVVVREVKAASAGALDVAEAPVVVSGGRGLKEPANFALLEDLAAAFGDTVLWRHHRHHRLSLRHDDAGRHRRRRPKHDADRGGDLDNDSDRRLLSNQAEHRLPANALAS
jgi:electron transfer flavoprotein alpha subunit